MPVHEGGTPLVQRLASTRPKPPPEGPALFSGDRTVVGAWQARARRERRTVRAVALAFGSVAAAAAYGDVLPPVAGIAVLGSIALLYPLLVLSAGSKAAQLPFEVHETGVWGTERRRLLRFRRFADWSQVAVGQAREVAAGRFHLQVSLLDGTVLSSVPGELSAEAVEYIDERAGHQIRRA